MGRYSNTGREWDGRGGGGGRKIEKKNGAIGRVVAERKKMNGVGEGGGGGGGESWCFTVHRSEDRKVCVGRGGTGERERDALEGGGWRGEGGRPTESGETRLLRERERERETQREVRKSLGCH